MKDRLHQIAQLRRLQPGCKWRPDAPTVFIIDDDAGVRASIQGLLKSVGLRSECFERAEQFLQRKPAEIQVASYWT